MVIRLIVVKLYDTFSMLLKESPSTPTINNTSLLYGFSSTDQFHFYYQWIYTKINSNSNNRNEPKLLKRCWKSWNFGKWFQCVSWCIFTLRKRLNHFCIYFLKLEKKHMRVLCSNYIYVLHCRNLIVVNKQAFHEIYINILLYVDLLFVVWSVHVIREIINAKCFQTYKSHMTCNICEHIIIQRTIQLFAIIYNYIFIRV